MISNTAGTHIFEISLPKRESQFIRRISLDISRQKMKYYSLPSMDLNSKGRVRRSSKSKYVYGKCA
jgi:hypothetical protein